MRDPQNDRIRRPPRGKRRPVLSHESRHFGPEEAQAAFFEQWPEASAEGPSGRANAVQKTGRPSQWRAGEGR
jgi:hypothetical protein